MAELDSLVRHAITPPQFDNKTKIHRDRLVDILHANVPRKLIAVAAPPGYGKTTLLADFTANTDLPVCWVRLTEADKDVVRLATVLAASIQKRFRRLQGQPNLASLVGATPEALAIAFTRAIDERVSEAFVIALDDIQIANQSKAVLKFLDAFLEAQPDQVTLIAAGQEVLEVSLARLMAEGALAGLGPHDLALTREELNLLAQKQLGAAIDEAEAGRLLEETRGWITGVLLSRLVSGSARSALVQSSGPLVYEYLASVVLNRQPDDLRRFLLDSAVMPVISAEACDYVLQRTDSQRYLARLVREGLFVTTASETPRTYEYHPQLRQFLLELSAAADPKRVKKSRVRAADYFAKHGSPEQAVELYLAAGAGAKAARLADQHAMSMFKSGRKQTLQDWAHRLSEAGAPAPKVLLYLSKSLNDQGDLKAAEEAVLLAEASFKARGMKAMQASCWIHRGLIALRQSKYAEAMRLAQRAERYLATGRDRNERAKLLRLKALTMHGQRRNLNEARALAEEAVALLEGGGDPFDLVATLPTLSLILTDIGEPIAAQAASLRAHQLLRDVGFPIPLAASFNDLAVDAHAQGRYDEALALFHEGLKFARQGGSPLREANILLGQADLFTDLGMIVQAAELYGQALAIASRSDHARLIRYGCLRTSVLHRRRGGGDVPHQWLQRAIAVPGLDAKSPAILLQLAALEASAAPQNALATLTDLLGQDSAELSAAERTAALYFLARACLVAGDVEGAERHLREAFAWAGGHGAEQELAAELGFDGAMAEFARLRLRGNPVLAVVLNRVETMRGIARQYPEAAEVEAPTPTLEFSALGNMEIALGGEPLGELKPLAREVLFYLVDNRRVERDVLLEAFWPHYPPGRQVSNLYTAVYSLRRALGKEAVFLDGSVYGLDPHLAVEYDVVRYERAASVAESLPRGDPRRFFALTEAINSYGGRFLGEFASDWVLERRRELEGRFLDLLLQHGEEALVRDQPLRAVNSLRRALTIDSYRDDLNMLYLEALGRLERRSEIVAHYQTYVRLLADELGLDPPDSLRELYTRLIG